MRLYTPNIRETQLWTEQETTLQFSKLLLIQAASVLLRQGEEESYQPLASHCCQMKIEQSTEPASISFNPEPKAFRLQYGFEEYKRGEKMQRNNTHDGSSEY